MQSAQSERGNVLCIRFDNRTAQRVGAAALHHGPGGPPGSMPAACRGRCSAEKRINDIVGTGEEEVKIADYGDGVFLCVSQLFEFHGIADR